MNCYVWELEAILEGLKLKQLDDQESQVHFGFNLRYILNAKKPQVKKVFDKKKQENKIKRLFRSQAQPKRDDKRLNKAIQALEYFKNRK